MNVSETCFVEQSVIQEATEIYSELLSPKARKLKIGTKQGGYTAAFYSPDLVRFRVDSWLKMLKAQKRLACIHEYLHFLGVKHTIDISFLGASDLISVKIYKMVWGEDLYWRELENKLNNTALSLTNYFKVGYGLR